MCMILIIDDNLNVAKSLGDNFKHFGYHCDYTDNGAHAVKLIIQKQYSLVLLDLMLGSENGIDILQKVKKIDEQLPVILITGFGTIDSAVQAIKYGAYDYIEKPVNFNKLRVIARNAIELYALKRENYKLTVESGADKVITNSEKMLQIVGNALILANSELPILILGESGTGKEIFAELIHKNSSRRDREMERINSASFADTLLDNELFGHEKDAYTGANSLFKGVFERADNTTLFLDEIGDMPLTTQAKILRAIQNQEIRRLGGSANIKINTRFIAATNKEIETLLQQGKFREDLYYRLNAGMLRIPPLRERKEDIPILCRTFILGNSKSTGSEPKTITDDVFKLLSDYNWPGNVRELKSCILYGLTMSRTSRIEVGDLPTYMLRQGKIHAHEATVTAGERVLITNALEQARFNKTRAAQILGISRRTLYNKMETYNIE